MNKDPETVEEHEGHRARFHSSFHSESRYWQTGSNPRQVLPTLTGHWSCNHGLETCTGSAHIYERAETLGSKLSTCLLHLHHSHDTRTQSPQLYHDSLWHEQYPDRHPTWLQKETVLWDQTDNHHPPNSQELADGSQVDANLLDFRKAFDKVLHACLMQRLDYYGVRGNVHNWI